ncbi:MULTISPECIES: fimbrial protein [Erwinia]|uniref:fimbrial protein n=1 Tax=Erwinia TaxID=551 RepID=UPI001F11C7AB|nr:MULTISPECIES: fimbrial protein [Erwinia]MCS3608619.1 type 1 fimbria pilin [Erwinia rhapontici]
MHNLNNSHPFLSKILYSGMLLVVIVTVSPNIVAAQDCKNCTVDVSFTGIYNDETCEIVINGKENTDIVELPVISTQSLKVPGSEAGSGAFDIGLKNCPTNRNIILKFVSNTSQADPLTGNLLNTLGDGYSKNTQIRLRKEDGTQISIDDQVSAQNYFISESGDMVTHDYIANYYSSGKKGVTPGLVKTTAGIELFYK